ncbi:MAG: hypothetical protein LBL93_03060 [Ruminococcus sp.]|jgi:hypothetical protein|nr:hypothetical protein [Ruminococcus sp.]
MTYLIDYENVHNNGIEKINTFKENDKVVIFYHIDNSKFAISLNKFADMIKKKIEFQLEKFNQENVTDKDKPNYLDFQLATYLGYLISQNEKEEYTIVSNDKDYKAVIDFWKAKRISVKLLKINTVNTKTATAPVKENSATKITSKQQIANEIKNEYGKEIGEIFSKAKNSGDLHNNIVHKLSDTSKSEKQRREIYKKIRPKFKEYSKL